MTDNEIPFQRVSVASHFDKTCLKTSEDRSSKGKKPIQFSELNFNNLESSTSEMIVGLNNLSVISEDLFNAVGVKVDRNFEIKDPEEINSKILGFSC